MDCAECREWMLEADPALLEPNAEPTAALHLAQCDACRTVAGQLRESHRALRASYRQIVPRQVPVLGDLPITRPRRLALYVSMAAAATIAMMLITRREWRGAAVIAPAAMPAASAPSVAVEVPDGHNAIVFKTRNPLIDVIWIYQGE